jgi:dienelactone hydrolase
MTSKNKRKWPWLIGAIIAVVVIACGVYLSDYYHADMEAVEAFAPEAAVEIAIVDDGNYIIKPENPTAGIIFYPGGKVEYTAYIPLMKQLASEGVMGVLVKMPFNLAVFDIDAAEGIQEQYPEIEKWYIGGHSLGGSMAAAYLEEHTDAFDGLILLGSYSTTDLTSTDLDVLSIYGSEDRVLNAEKYEEYKVNLPEEFVEMVIDGGCHAYFGAYGMQEGDGEPGITCEEQTDITVKNITEFINKI